MVDRNKKNLHLQQKFLLGLAGILVLFATLVSVSIFYYQAKAFEYDNYQKAGLIMSAIKSTRGYVRSVLRPKMYEIIDEDDFIIEAMSSSYVTRIIAENFTEENNVIYRRVATDARNKNYEANELERGMISYFKENPKIEQRHEVIENKQGQDIFMNFEPVIMKASCLNCHGNPTDAPKKIIEVYGIGSGFNRTEGDVVGVVSVAIPIDLNMPKAKEIAFIVLIGVVPAIIFLYTIISVFFNRVVSQNLRNTLRAFQQNMTDEKGAMLLAKTESLDEVESLNDMGVAIADHLAKSHRSLGEYAQKLYHSKEVLQSVFDGIADPVLLLNSKGVVKLVNSSFLEQYKLNINNSFGDISCHEGPNFCPLEDWQDILDKLDRKPVDREVRSQGKILRIYFYPVEKDIEDDRDVVCYIKDITEEKKLEKHIQHTEKIVSMGQVAAGVAHEINNPLGVILCHIDLIRDDENISDESREDLVIIKKHVDNCRRIVADLLRFSKPSVNSKMVCSVNDMILEVVSMMSGQLTKQNINLVCNLDSKLPDLFLDLDRFKQVILNLLLNSSHAIKQAGEVTISTSIEGPLIVLEIKDDGEGIPQNLLTNIFEPFFTTKEPGEGTGLGLSVSYGIVKNHNGAIVVESELGKGTCFKINIPLKGNLDD
ncbi:MAG: DUF3365 domain-containing protein [Desulfotalea sp.]